MIPTFFFHLTAAYCVLRNEGVPVQKGDFGELWPGVSEACKVGANPEFAVDTGSAAHGDRAPGAIRVGVKLFRRGKAGAWGCGNCANYSLLGIAVETIGNGDPIGFRLSAVGTPPESLRLPSTPVIASDGVITLHWDDSAFLQGPLDFELAVIPVDPAGNEGPPARVRIRDGRHVAWQEIAGVAILVAVTASWRSWRRRRARRRPF